MTRFRPTVLLLAAAALLACAEGDEPDHAVSQATPGRAVQSAAPTAGSSCIETRPLLSDDEARAFLGGLSAPGRCHTCAQARGIGSGCAWRLEQAAGMPRQLDAGVTIYQPGNSWTTTRSVRLRSGVYKDLPELPGEAHAAVIVGRLQIIMRLGDRGELTLMTASKGTAVDIPDQLAALARTFHARAIASATR